MGSQHILAFESEFKVTTIIEAIYPLHITLSFPHVLWESALFLH